MSDERKKKVLAKWPLFALPDDALRLVSEHARHMDRQIDGLVEMARVEVRRSHVAASQHRSPQFEMGKLRKSIFAAPSKESASAVAAADMRTIMLSMQRMMELSLLFGMPLAQMPSLPVVLDDSAMLLLERLDEREWDLRQMSQHGTRSAAEYRDLLGEIGQMRLDLADIVTHLARYPDMQIRRDGAWHMTLSKNVLLYTLFIPLRNPGSGAGLELVKALLINYREELMRQRGEEVLRRMDEEL